MKKCYPLLAVALITGLWSAPASAASHYVSGNVGATWMNDVNDRGYYDNTFAGPKLNLKSGINALGAVGCDFGQYRMEGELGYQTSGVNNRGSVSYTGDITVVSAMANGYVDLSSGSLRPYITAGAGVAQVSGDQISASGSGYTTMTHDTTLAYQVGAGVAVPIAGNVMLDARYRYFATTEFAGNDNIKVSSHGALLGLRFGF